MSVWSLKLGSSKLRRGRRSSVAEIVLVTYTCSSGIWRELCFFLLRIIIIIIIIIQTAYGTLFLIISDCPGKDWCPADVGEKVLRVNQIRWRDLDSSSSASSTPPLPLLIAPFFFFLRRCRFFPRLLRSLL